MPRGKAGKPDRYQRKGREAKERLARTGLTLKQEAYCREYVVDESQTAAAVRAGYAPGSAKVKASEMMRNPLVIDRINALRDARNERALMTGADLLRYAQTALLTCFTDHFTPGQHGRWVCTREAYTAIPVEVKRLIEEMETRTYTNPETGETEETLHVRFVSKGAMVAFLGKYMLTERTQTTTVVIDWNSLVGRPAKADPVESEIARVSAGRPPVTVPVAATHAEVAALMEYHKINPRPRDDK